MHGSIRHKLVETDANIWWVQQICVINVEMNLKTIIQIQLLEFVFNFIRFIQVYGEIGKECLQIMFRILQ